MKGLRIATVYRDDAYEAFPAFHMAGIRWLRISQGLASLGAEVDLVANVECGGAVFGDRLRVVGFGDVRWRDYDVVKTLYHRGFDTLVRHGGGDHPRILSSIATVVGRRGVADVHVLEADRPALWATQQRIAGASRWISVRTEANRALWLEELPGREAPLLVPTGVDREVPAPRANPYEGFQGPVAVYAGNLAREVPGQLNAMWADRLNRLGAALKRRGIRLCFVGQTRGVELDPRAVTDLGPVPNPLAWDHHRFAAVGIALAEGLEQRNESSKLYYYLRAGTPVVSEAPIPNNDLLDQTNMGLVSPYDDVLAMAERIEEAVQRDWPREVAIRQMIDGHSWERRAESYLAPLACA